MYALDVDDPEALVASFTDYDRMLWTEHGCTLEQITWYKHRLAEFPKRELMQAEFPTTPLEAFVSSDANVFSNNDIEALRENCRAPRTGEIDGAGAFVECAGGKLQVWERPLSRAEYVAVVDVGGRSEKSDWSVIAVLKRGAVPEVVAQWRGHIDHDLLGDRAMSIARHYNRALLVIESNSLESAPDESVSATVLARVASAYDNTYRRKPENGAAEGNVGFHTNRNTKARVIDTLVAALRDKTYVERDNEACNEMATYCRLPNGSYEARRGCHDDILMTRAIGLYVIGQTGARYNPAEWAFDDLPAW